MTFKRTSKEGIRQFKKQLALLKEVTKKKSKSNLKFDINYLKVSEIADQHYCELKVENKYLYGKKETIDMLSGRQSHEDIIKNLNKITLKDVWKNIFTKRDYQLAEFPLVCKYKSIILLGRPDLVIFINAIPTLIIDFKFSKYSRTFISHHIQVYSYGNILEEIGFKTSALFLAIVVAPFKLKNKQSIMIKICNNILRTAIQNLLLKKERIELSFGKVKVEILRYNSLQAETYLDNAIDFWTGKRNALYVDNKNKCINCEYKIKCSN